MRYMDMFMVVFIAAVLIAPPSGPAAAAEEFRMEVTNIQENTQTAPSDDLLQVEIIHDEQNDAYVGKRILIYHTHTFEAYEQDADDPYKQTEKWRTTDNAHNVVAVGKALAASLQALGIEVTHDTTAFEPPTLEDAYSRSLTMLEERIQRGENYDLYIDLHRDAIASTSTIKRTVNIGGENVARYMILIGKGTTGGYTQTPNWETNLVYADLITENLNRQCANLARDVKIKTGRFNQHVDDCCILIECGMNSNTLEEVLTGLPYLAQAIADALAYAPQR